MEQLLALVRATEQSVLDVLKRPEEPMRNVLAAYNEYRRCCQDFMLADFQHAEREESRLWYAHTEGRKYFHRALSTWRKSNSNANRPVETRELMKLYKDFLKQSSRFYSDYIQKLYVAAGGLPELEDIAQKVKKSDDTGESLLSSIPFALRKQVLLSCHRSLIYLGDLWRYRASEQLDRKALDFGPAVGYYSLAATLIPSSGLGHHQQAVVALAQNHHLRAIHHLYRSIVVSDPHPAAANNLRLEFDKTNAAWEKGELIRKGPANDPNAPKQALIGLFVRLHGMCYKGGPFRGYDELEREVLAQLVNAVKQRDLGETFSRMILINVAAQYVATDRFREDPADESRHDAFLYFFRFNLKTFTALLQVFHDDLRTRLIELNDIEAELPTKLTSVVRRLLPALRLYTNWLLTHPIVQMTQVLGDEVIVQDGIHGFWPLYARTVDLVAQAFPIWDLDDLPSIDYMYEEDVDTLEFKPLEDERSRKTWHEKQGGTLKKRFFDRGVVRRSSDEEALHKIKDFLADGAYLANDSDDAPVKLFKTRFFVGDESQIEPLVIKPFVYQPGPIAPPIPAQSKPVSYASAAANGHARRSQPATGLQHPIYTQTYSQEAQLTRMVDALLDDEDAKSSPRPLQQTLNQSSAIGYDKTHELHDSMHDLAITSAYSHQPHRPSTDHPSLHASVALTPPVARPYRNSGGGLPSQDIQRIWQDAQSPSFSAGLPTGTLGSPAMISARGHSRVNSASSNRSRSSTNGGDHAWSHRDAAPRAIPEVGAPFGATYIDQSGTTGPFLFGAGDSLWSSDSRDGGFKTASPPWNTFGD